MIISIHQPNYLPWPGFFNKIISSDIFVIFDDVQFPRGKDFVYRNRIKTQSGEKWLTLPILDKSKMLNINQVHLNNNINWKEEQWNSLKNNYHKAKFKNETLQIFEEVFSKDWDLLVDLNYEFIKKILAELEIKRKIVKSSELKINDKGELKIIKIIKKLGGDEYISGNGEGSMRYISGNEQLFDENGIKVRFQNFKNLEYSQLFGKYIPGLSICDMLFNIGKKDTKKMIVGDN